ncbi:unnamed protein product [Gordionus sp. m RMFG-2023]|uniref:histone-lysine N-methyltransferase SMYD3-like isoform X2 n=1 Tax=Gordionus sp. m RMFG-2023 TaxID=3053472 RepID=UPI0030E1CC85
MKENILLRRGTLLFSEEPYAVTLSDDCRSTHCSYCFAKNKLSKCISCELHRYCNKACQAKDWVDHKYECKIIKGLALEDRVRVDYQFHLLFRIIFKLERKSTKDDPENLISYCNEKIKLTKYNFMDLKEHFLKDMEMSKSEIKVHLDLLKILLPQKIWDKYEQILPHIYCKILINSFTIMDEHRQGIGSGIFINHSKVNHNCIPNGVCISNGRTQHLVLIEDVYLPNANDLEKYVHITYMNPISSTCARQHFFKNNLHFTCDCALCCSDKTQEQSSNSLENEYKIDIIDEYLPKYDFQESDLDIEELQIYQEQYFSQYLTKKNQVLFSQKSKAVSFPVSTNIVYNTMLQANIDANVIDTGRNLTRRDPEAKIIFKIMYEMCRALESGHILKKNYGKYEVYLAIHWYRMATLSKALNYKSSPNYLQK